MTRFLLDVMCGKLAVYLRFCGHDAAYALDRGVEADDRLVELASAEGRTLLTRDVRLAERTQDATLLTERDVEGQLRELRDEGVELALPDRPTRCGACNGVLEPATDDTGSGVDRPEYVPDDGPVYRCRDCGRWFWRGSHWDAVAATLDGL